MFQKFFELYTAAFLSFNSSYISDAYDYPMVFYTETGDILTLEKDAFSKNIQQVFANYKSIGVQNVSFEIKDTAEISGSLTLVTVHWYFKDGANNEIYNATTKYVIRETGTGLKIKSVFVIDETSKFSKLKTN